MRKIEYSLIVIVVVFVSVVLPIFNKENVMDFGNSSDIASAFGTLGTLAVAFIALRKAPEWLHQKMDEHAFNIAKDLIVTDFPKIETILVECARHFDHFTTCYELIDAQESLRDLLELTQDKNKLLNELEPAFSKIKSNAASLKKLGWTFKPSFYEQYIDTHKNQRMCIDTIKIIYNRVDQIKRYVESPNPNPYFQHEKLNTNALALTKLCANYKKYHVLYSDCYSRFIDSGATVPEYFDIKEIKITKSS